MPISIIISKFKEERIQQLLRQSWSVSWPMALIRFLVFSIGLADVYVAGKFSKVVLASYGVSSQIYFIFSIIAFALTVGTVAVVSQLFSSENNGELIKSIDSSITAAIVTGLLAWECLVIFWHNL